MSDAAVGSISHILKTAFKETYDEPGKREKAAAARLLKAVDLSSSSSTETPEGADTPSTPHDGTPPSYLAPLERLKVAENLTAYLSEQHTTIEKDLTNMAKTAGELALYLRERKQEAYLLEEMEEEELKKQGVMLGQHIPSLPSKLDIDPRLLQNAFGQFSNKLVVAKELVEQNKQNTLRRTGNMPISDIAEQIKTQRLKKAAAGGADVPHYLYETGSAQVRKERIALRFAAIKRAKELEEEEKLAQSAGLENASIATREPQTKQAHKKHHGKLLPVKKDVLTGAQRLANEEILKGMNHKLNYLRNPRNIPHAMNRLLVKSEAAILGSAAVSIYAGFGAVSSSEEDSQPLTKSASVLPSIAEQSTHPTGANSPPPPQAEDNSRSRSSSHPPHSPTSRAKFGEMPQVTVPLFVCEPSALSYTEYEVGREYKQPVAFRNVSAVSRMVRVLPPATSFFSLSPLNHPPGSKSGICAAGMCVTATLTFFPKSLGAYEDSLQVETEGGSFTVPIVARRESPKLSLPLVIDVGACLVGDAIRVTIKCTNSGGAGSFRLVSAEDYPNEVPHYDDSHDPGCARMPSSSITMYPILFTLEKNQSVDLNIEFLPLFAKDYLQGFHLLCDSTQVFSYSIKACAKVLNLAVVEINNVPFDSTNQLVRRDMFFEAANLGIEQTQQIVVVNDTGIPVEFEWVIVDANTRDKDLHKAGQNRIKEREHKARSSSSASVGHTGSNGTPSSPSSGTRHKPTTAMRNGFDPTPNQSHVEIAPASPTPSPNKSLSPVPGKAAATGVFSPMQTLLETFQQESPMSRQGNKNSVIEKEFEIFPARGTMPSDGAEPFTFSFTPVTLKMASQRAVLMVRGVPLVALPGASQESLLSKLQHQGHGQFVRLLSWLDDMGSSARVDKYYKSNGMSSTYRQLNNLNSLLGLVIGHASASSHVEQVDVYRVELSVRALIRHFEGWIADEVNESLLAELDDEGVPIHAEGQVLVAAYKWDGRSGSIPETAPVLNLSKALAAAAAAAASASATTASQAAPRKNVGPEEDEAATDDQDQQRVSFSDEAFSSQAFPPLTEAERALMSVIHLDSEAMLEIMGPFIAEVLDDKVKHEAVDFVRELVHLDVAVLSLGTSGEGKPQEINISPPLLTASGLLSVGQSWIGTFKLTNPSSAMAEINICTEELQVFGVLPAAPKGGQHCAPPFRAIIPERNSFSFPEKSERQVLLHQDLDSLFLPLLETSRFLVQFEPPRVLLLPESEAEVEITVTPLLSGEFTLVVPCCASTANARVDSVTLSFTCAGPRVRFTAPEVDLGLIGVRSSSSATFNFTNDSPAPATFSFTTDVEPDPELERAERALGLTSVGALGGGGSTRESKGQPSTPSAYQAMASARSDSDTLELNAAVMTVSPPGGLIGPGETITGTITCRAGKLPQRLRGSIECRIWDSSGAVEQATQFQSFRGEIQAPKTIMYPMLIDLGVVFMGMPVSFSVSTENICNLPTTYKLARPGGDSPSFSLVFDKPSGPLGAKEKVTVRGTFTALLPGKIDDVISNKIFGVLTPLGFSINAVAKPLQVDFPLLREGAAPPLPLAPPTATQFTDNGAPPDPAAIEPLDFTHSVPLYERKVQRFALRNLSAIPASFELHVKKFVVLDNIGSDALFEVQMQTELAAAAASNDGGTKNKGRGNRSAPSTRGGTAPSMDKQDTAGGMNAPWLKPREDGVHKFHSVDGKKYSGAAVERQENRKFLTSGLGAAFLVEPPIGVLPPWGVVLVTVRAFNDMPALYDDELEVSLIDVNQNSKRALIPLKMKVQGCPLVIEDASLGMTTVSRDKSVPLQQWQRSQPDKLLALGVACVNAEPPVREFRVRNNGSMAAKVAWKVRSMQGKINGPVKLELALREAEEQSEPGKPPRAVLRVKTSLLFWSDVAKETPFRVVPESATIKSYGTASFSVTMYKTDVLGREDAQLVGNVFFDPNGTTGLALNPSGASIATADLGDKSQVLSIDTPSIASTLLPAESVVPPSYRLDLQLQAEIIAPRLSVNGRILVASEPTTTSAPESMALKFKADATELFARRRAGESRAVVSKTVPIINPTDAAVVVSVSTQGPFILALQHDDSAVVASPGTATRSSVSMSQTMPSMSKMRTTFGSDTIGKTVTLMPKSSASFTLSFNPTRSLREMLTQTPKGDAAGAVPDERGLLVLAFSTGQRVTLPLSAQISAPFLAGSSPRLLFGTVSVGFETDGSMLLSNPTAVPARWSVMHVPGGKGSRPSAIKVPGFAVPEAEVDDPDAFLITPSAGVVQGPTVSETAATATLPKDYNRSDETVVPQRLSESSWSTSTLSFQDTIARRHTEQHKSASDSCYPQPVQILFHPSQKGKHASRFRFTCEFGNSFDVILEGRGTFEEMEHAPLRPTPESSK